MKIKIDGAGDANNLPDSELKNIIKEVEGLYKLPSVKLSQQVVICLVGLVGSGKSTIAEILCKAIPLYRLRTDSIRTILNVRGYNYDRISDISFSIFKKYIDAGYSIVIDADMAGQKVRDQLESMIADRNIKSLYVHVVASEKAILERLGNGNKDRDFVGDLAISDYYRRKKLHSDLNINFFHTINTDSTRSGPQITDLINKIKLLQV